MLCRWQRIDGEVYDVDDQMLTFMDHFEGHPEVYSRDRVRVHFLGPPATSTGTNSDSFDCWTYFLKSFPPSLVYEETTNFYDSYSSKPYRPESVTNCSSSFESSNYSAKVRKYRNTDAKIDKSTHRET